jgi:hypothetical protein
MLNHIISLQAVVENIINETHKSPQFAGKTKH